MLLQAELDSPALQEFAYTVLALFYAASDESGRNPNWDAIGYPGPADGAALPGRGAEDDPRRAGSAGEPRSTADVCIVGSGAGGSVVAATLQAAGLSVIVLERGGYRNEADFRQLEDVGAARPLHARRDVLLQSTARSDFLRARRSAAAR